MGCSRGHAPTCLGGFKPDFTAEQETVNYAVIVIINAVE